MLAGALLTSGAPAGAQGPYSPVTEAMDLRSGETLLEVSAEGSSFNRPSNMSFHAGVVAVGPTARDALRANSAEMNAVVAAIRSLGIEARDIRTDDLRVEPQVAEQPENYDQDRDPQPPRILGYITRNTVDIRLRSLDRAGEIIGAIFEAGANYVRGPTFELDDQTRDSAIAVARADAAANARSEAENYAESFGLGIARVIRISERSARTDSGRPIVVTGTRIGGVPVEPGEIETTVQLWVDYALVPQ